MKNKKLRLLINLPPAFFACEQLKPVWRRLAKNAVVRRTSHNTPEEIAPDLAWAEAILMWSWPVLTDEQVARAPQLRFVGYINSTQTAARALFTRRVAVSEARTGWSPAVAEMALTLILTGLRKVSEYHAQMRAGTEPWVDAFPTDIDPHERQLTGRRVGIVGFGRIGQRLAELLVPFQVTLRAYDPFLPKAVAARYGAQLCSLPVLLRSSEVLVMCAANNKGSDHLVGAREIALIKPHSVLVNVGRASLLDMEALEKRIKKGDLIALLDVFEKEPLEKDAPLRRLPNTYLTPHRAGGVMESVVRIMTMLADDLEACFNKKPRRYALTEQMLASLPD